jgi:hypothetical protein
MWQHLQMFRGLVVHEGGEVEAVTIEDTQGAFARSVEARGARFYQVASVEYRCG